MTDRYFYSYLNKDLNRYFKRLFIALTALLLACCYKNERQEKGTVYLEQTTDGWELYRNDKLFEIKGASANNRFRELKSAGANTVRVYDTTNLKSVLDSAHSYHLAVIVDLPIRRYVADDIIYADTLFTAQELHAITATVKKYKNHPALLYWILGNEVNYPDNPLNNSFVKHFNNLLEAIHSEDVNHPVSTAIAGFARLKIVGIKNFSPDIDFISLNIFGALSSFQRRTKEIAWLWDGPYVLTEFGINGPWEVDNTTWAAPIEETSTKKAEHYNDRYRDFIYDVASDRRLGTLFFYWGSKQERTHTWFSTFDDEGRRNESAFVMENIWKNKKSLYKGPKINYITLNGKTAVDNIVLNSKETMEMELFLENPEILKNSKVSWAVRKESWNYTLNEVEKRPKELNLTVVSLSKTTIAFRAPEAEGPYRVYLSITKGETFATANIPFYILD